jgi:hypothetical protein
LAHKNGISILLDSRKKNGGIFPAYAYVKYLNPTPDKKLLSIKNKEAKDLLRESIWYLDQKNFFMWWMWR